MLLGLRGDKLPTKPEVEYMVTMLQEDYGNLPIGELDLAFELMAKNKLDENPETYQNFSVLYMSRMMTSYARFVRNNYVEPKIEYNQVEYKKEKESCLEFSLEIYKKNKDKSFKNIFMALDVFQELYDQNKLNIDYNEVYDITVNVLKMEIIDNVSRRKIKELLEDDDKMENMCRRMAVKMYFDSL